MILALNGCVDHRPARQDGKAEMDAFLMNFKPVYQVISERDASTDAAVVRYVQILLPNGLDQATVMNNLKHSAYTNAKKYLQKNKGLVITVNAFPAKAVKEQTKGSIASFMVAHYAPEGDFKDRSTPYEKAKMQFSYSILIPEYFAGK